tara:strand:- start:15124 stop:16434 length:1311 start_codon:yes stop_codon:yes gene_type:complete
MKVLNLKVKHILGLKELDLDLDEGMILVGGANGQGKSSTLNALKMALCGKRGTDWPEKALHDGEDEGEVVVTLSGDPSLGEDEQLKVHLEISQKRSGEIDKITIYDSTGEPAPNPRTLLSDLYSLRGFDPLDFARQKPADQRETLAKLVGVDLDAARVEYKSIYDERALVNREVKRLEIRVSSSVRHDDVPEDLVDTADLVEQISRIRKQNSELTHYTEVVNSYAKEQQRAIERVTKTEEKLRLVREELEANQVAFKQSCKHHDEAKKHLLTLPDLQDDKPILDNIAFAAETNEKIRQNNASDVLKTELKIEKEKSGTLTARLSGINERVDKQVREAEFPVSGMSIDKEGVLLNGNAFSDCSRSERITASCMVGIALHPTLQLFVCEDGSDLDTESIEILDSVMQEYGYTMLTEIVTRNEEDERICKVVIEAGEAK